MHCLNCNSKNVTKLLGFRRNYLQCQDCRSVIFDSKWRFNIFDLLYFTPLSHFGMRDESNTQFSYYLNKTKENFDEKSIKKHPRYKVLSENLDEEQHAKILDISAGPGDVGLGIQKLMCNTDYYCTEYDPTIVEHMTNVLSLKCYELDLTNIDASNLNEDSFDIIMCFHSLYYCNDLMKFKHLCDRVLKPGGMLVVKSNVPSAQTVYRFTTTENYPPINFFSETKLRKIFEDDYTIEEVQVTNTGSCFRFFKQWTNLRRIVYNCMGLGIILYLTIYNFLRAGTIFQPQESDYLIFIIKNGSAKDRT